MIDWKLALSAAGSIRHPFAATQLAEGQPEEGLTAHKLADAVFEIERIMRETKPHPLLGARALYAHDNMMTPARKLADEIGELLVMRSALVPPGYIVAMDGSKVIAIINSEKE